MDPVGTTASIITLIVTIATVAESLQNIYDRWRNAPHHVRALAALLLSIKARLDLLQHISTNGHSLIIDPTSGHKLDGLLEQARKCIEQSRAILERVQRHGDYQMRAMWTVRESRRVDRTMERLRDVEYGLSRWTETLLLIGQCSALAGIDELKQIVTTMCVAPVVQNTIASSQAIPLNNLERRKRNRVLRCEPLTLGAGWVPWGLRGSLIATSQGPYWDYYLAMQMSIPCSQILGCYALILELSFRTSPLCWTRLTLRNPSSLAVARVVGDQSDFMVACDRGDLLAVRSMLLDGRGRPTDVGERNWTPITVSKNDFAIRSGSVEVVRELLDNGADINATFGMLQTTPLQWSIWQQQLDITRLLLDRGASQDHINNIGWNTSFYCWPFADFRQRCMTDFLNVLVDDAVQDLDVTDTEGWTVLHRVAAYGTAEEVLALIRQGADVQQVALPLCWNALHHAVFYGNESTFKALLPRFGDQIKSMTDERGWTLLHIAASAGHDAIVLELLKHGLDPNGLSTPFMSHMPESLFKRACTPREVAAAQSQEREERFLKAWWDSGVGGLARDFHVDNDGDMFWEATEEVCLVPV